jgi:hypothetical protein
MRTRTIRAWAVVTPLAAVLWALARPSGLAEAAAGGLCLAGIIALAALDGLRQRGMPRRR